MTGSPLSRQSDSTPPLDRSSDEARITMTRCPESGSVFTCGCEGRWDGDRFDWSCAGDKDPACWIDYERVAVSDDKEGSR